jgi:glycosyltransferase involved in cell wall biosynthesis
MVNLPDQHVSEIELTVVLPVFNGATTLTRQLDALAAQEWQGSWEVLIVDNDSDDETPGLIEHVCERLPKRFRQVAAKERRNVSYAINVGVNNARGRSVTFCAADDLVGPDWVAAVGNALRSAPLVGSRLDNTLFNPPEVAAASRYQTEELGTLFGKPVVAGGGLGCHVELWNALGGMDPHFIAEDTEFSLRALTECGVEPVFVPDAVYHVQLRESARSEFHRASRQTQSTVQLFKLYGRPCDRRSLRVILYSLLTTVRLAVRVHHPVQRRLLARNLGRHLGRVIGSVRYRTLYL